MSSFISRLLLILIVTLSGCVPRLSESVIVDQVTEFMDTYRIVHPVFEARYSDIFTLKGVTVLGTSVKERRATAVCRVESIVKEQSNWIPVFQPVTGAMFAKLGETTSNSVSFEFNLIEGEWRIQGIQASERGAGL